MNASPSRTDPAPADFAGRRQTMVDSQLRTVGVSDAAVVAAMGAVPREKFVAAAQAGLAYADAALEVAPGRWLLEPMALGLLLQAAEVGAGDRLLIVGAATGYSAAVAAAIGARVTALESDPDLAARAAGIANAAGIEIVEGPLADGWAAAAPYDVILFEGAIETLPGAIAAQLAPAGRVAAVVRIDGVGHAMAGPVIGSGDTARIGGQAFLEVAARPLPGFARARAFAF